MHPAFSAAYFTLGLNMSKLPSFHDDYLIAYEVACEAHEVRLLIRSAADGSLTRVTFTGVEGYHFENDAMGNIISGLEEVEANTIIEERRTDISKSFRIAGAPGPWAANLDSASQSLASKGARGYRLSSSFGMSGWVLASRVEAQPALPADAPRAVRSVRG